MDSNYVSQKNISKIVQWLTAELIKSEPENPIAFLHELTGQHTKNATVEILLRESIKGVSAAKLRTNLDVLSLERVSQSLSEISHFKIDDPKAVDTILNKITELTKAKSCYMHYIDSDARIITLSYGGETTIAFGEGLVGEVAESCVPLSKESDQITSKYLDTDIQSTCACPLFDTNEKLIGVVQLINKKGGNIFTPQDLLVLSIFCSELTVFTSGASSNHEADIHALVDLLETVRSSRHTQVPVSSLMFTITRRTTELIGTDRCTLFVVDQNAQQMWSMQGEINIRIPINAGIAGGCATSGEIINIPDAYKDERFNPAFDKKSGYHTKTILCIPMKHDEEVVGVLQLINKFDGVFTDEDAKLLTLILEDAAATFATIETSQKIDSGPEMPSDVLEMQESGSRKISTENRQHLLPLIEETEEEEDAFG